MEDAEGVAASQEPVGLRVVQWRVFQHDPLTLVVLDVVQTVVEYGQVAQAQEVHLEKPELLAGIHVELGDDRAVVTFPQRHHVQQFRPRQNDPGGVHAGLTFQAPRPRAVATTCCTCGSASCRVRSLLPPYRGAWGRRCPTTRCPAHHGVRHGLNPVIWSDSVKAARVRARESLIAALALIDEYVTICATWSSPYFCCVANHLAAPALVEVHVDVRHRDAIRVQEALEDQSVLNGSSSVMPSAQAIKAPAAEPRPGPTRILLVLA